MVLLEVTIELLKDGAWEEDGKQDRGTAAKARGMDVTVAGRLVKRTSSRKRKEGPFTMQRQDSRNIPLSLCPCVCVTWMCWCSTHSDAVLQHYTTFINSGAGRGTCAVARQAHQTAAPLV